MGTAKHLSRVGGLAVALGIGAAVATGHGIAAAEPSDTSSDSGPSDSSSSDSSQNDSTDNNDSDTSTKTESSSTEDDDNSDTTDTVDAETDEEEADTDSEVSEVVDEVPEVVVDEVPVVVDEVPAPEPVTETVVEETGSTGTETSDAPVDSAPEPRDESVDEPQAGVVETIEGTIDEVVADVVATDEVAKTAVVESEAPIDDTVTTTVYSAVATTTAAPAPLRAPAPTPVSLITGFLTAIGLSPLAAPGPAAPMELPIMWAVLGWVRRTLFNESPQPWLTAQPQTATGQITGTIARDPDGDPLKYTLVTPPADGSVVFNPDGTYTYTASPELLSTGGSDSFTVAVADQGFHLHGLLSLLRPGHGHTTVVTVPVTVTAVNPNHAPTIDVTEVQNADGTNTFTVATDDEDGDAVTVTHGTLQHGTLADDGNGTWTYTPDPDYAHELSAGGSTTPGSETVVFTVTDAKGATATADGVAVIKPTNGAPTISQTSYGNADGSTVFVITASDPDGDDVTVTANKPGFGTLERQEDGTWLLTPDQDYIHSLAKGPALAAAMHTVTFTADDGHGLTASTSKTFTVVGENEAPTMDIATTDNTDGTTTITVTTADGDGDPVDVGWFGLPNGTIEDLGGGQYLYTPDADYAHGLMAPGSGFVIFQGNDGHYNGTVSRSVDLTIDPQNEAPVLEVAETQNADGTTTYTVTPSDADGDTVVVTASDPLHGTLVDNGDGSYTYTPDQDYALEITDAETDAIVFTADDGHYQGVVTETVNPAIEPINEAPTITVTVEPGRYPVVLHVDRLYDVVFFTVTATDPDGDPLTITHTNPEDGRLIDLGNGKYVYAYGDGAHSQAPVYDTFTFTATDPEGLSATSEVQSVQVPVSNQRPVVTVVSTPNQDGSVTLTPTVSDPDGDDVVITGVTATHGTVVDNGDGTYTYTADPDYAHELSTDGDTDPGTGVVRIAVEDSYGGKGFTDVSIAITPTNEAPTFVQIDDLYDDRQTGVIWGPAGFSDPDGDTLTYTVTGGDPTKATLTIDEDGVLTFTPTAEARHSAAAENASTTDKQLSYAITADDGHGATVTQYVSIKIIPFNVAPTMDVQGVKNADGTTTYTASTYDDNGDAVTVSASDPEHGTLVENTDGTWTYTPDSDYAHQLAAGGNTADGSDTVVFTASDGHNGRTVVTEQPSITPTNDTPTYDTADEIRTLDRATGLVTIVTGYSDPDGDDLTYTVSDLDPTKGSVTVGEDGMLTFTPTAEARHAAAENGAGTEAGRTTFTVTIDDGHGGTQTQTYQVRIVSFNTQPTIEVTGPENEDGSTTYTVVTDDADGDTVTVIARDLEHGTVTDNGDGTWTFTPDADYAHQLSEGGNTADGTGSVTFIALDNHDGEDAVTVQPSITPTNDGPIYDREAELFDVDESTGVISGPAGYSDGDGDTLTYTVTDLDPAKGTVTIDENGVLTYTPTAEARHAAADKDAPLSDKRAEFTVTADDGHGGTVVTTYRLRIYGDNNAPVFESADATVDESTGVVEGFVTAGDEDGDELDYRLDIGPGKGTVVVNSDGSYTYTPSDEAREAAAAADADEEDWYDAFTIAVDDGHTGGLSTTTVVVPVIPADNTAPTLTVTESTMTTGVKVYQVATTDDDGDPVTVTATTDGTYGTLTQVDATTWTYKPRANTVREAFEETIDFTASDGNGGEDVVVKTVEIPAAQNRAPDAADVNVVSVDEETGVTILSATASDPEDDPVTIVISGATNATIVDNGDGTWTYTPSPAYRHTLAQGGSTASVEDELVVTATDSFGASKSTTYSVTVTPQNEAPTMTVDQGAANAQGVIVFTVAGTDSDGDAVTITPNDPAYGTIAKTGTNTYTYTPDSSIPTTVSSDTVTFTATDTYGGSTVHTAEVALGHAPVIAVTQTGNTSTTGAKTYTITVTDVDAGDTPTVSVGTPKNGTISTTTVGKTTYLTYTPNAAYRHSLAKNGSTTPGTDTVKVTATDEQGLVTTSTISISVTPYNQVPTITTTTDVIGTTATIADGDNDAYTVTTTTSNGGSLTKVGNSYIYRGTSSNSSATLTVNDGYGGTVTRTFTGLGTKTPTPLPAL